MTDLPAAFPSLTLKRAVGRRAERGHLWVFSNEVESLAGDPQPGDEVRVFSAKRRFLGMGLFSQSSMIRARIYSRQYDERLDEACVARRLRAARAYRESLGPLPHSYRLCHSEADLMPGLVVDVFGDQAVIQISTIAMERRRQTIVTALKDLLAPAAIVERSDIPYRRVEGMEERRGTLHGIPRNPCEVHENGATALADLIEGQKTGYFLDQVHNRSLAAPFFGGARVLDLFCYVGAWSIVAGVHGARETLGVDSSQPALDLAARGAAINGLDPERCRFLHSDVFAFLREQSARRESYDVIVLDPPALAKSKKDAAAALTAYRELNLRAMKLLRDGGLLVTCSCSHNVGADEFRAMLIQAAKDARADFTLAREGAQSPDHPIHLATPETAYLKAFFLRRRPRG